MTLGIIGALRSRLFGEVRITHNTNRDAVMGSQARYRKKYLLMTEAFSQATTYLIFVLICIWTLASYSPQLTYQFVIILVAALFSFAMFLMFTVFMFSPQRVEGLRRFLISASPSDSGIKKAVKAALPVTLWAILLIIFLDGLLQGANRIPDNIRSIVILAGVFWLVVVPLASIIKLSWVDEKGYRRITNLWKKRNNESPLAVTEHTQTESVFRPDQPIQSYKDDLLGRASFAHSLGDAILRYKEKDSLVLGLLGTWGSGKTSVINMALEYIETLHEDAAGDTNPIIVRFNPWNYADQDQLIRQFFRQLSVSLGRDDYGASAQKIGTLIQAYARLLDPLACVPKYGLIAAIFSAVLRFFGEALTTWGSLKSSDLDSVKSELNHLLDQQKRKIIIVIDDVDRLSDREIRQTFQLVKSLGDFHNTIYILAFDKKVVIGALNRVQEGLGFEYLEKVVQVPFEIPLIPKEEVDSLLLSQLGELTGEIPEGKWDPVRWVNVYIGGLKHFFRTIRDVNRYVNSLKFGLGIAKEEVNITDFLAITAVQVFIPEVYYGVRENKEVFSGVIGSTLGPTDVLKERIRAKCDEIIGRAHEYPEEKVRELLKLLFPKLEAAYGNTYYGPDWLGEWRRDGRICSPDMFDIFFRLFIPQGEIRKTEMEAILSLTGNPSVLAEALLKLNEEGTVVRFLERLEDYTQSHIRETDIENVITVLMDIGDLFPQEEAALFAFDTPMRVLRICYQLIRRFDSHERRFMLLKNAMEKANNSLFTIVHEVRVQERRHVKDEAHQPPPDRELIVNAEQLKQLEQLACSKIEIWATDGRLANHRDLAYLLYGWREWGGSSNMDSFVKDMIKTDDGLMRFIAAFLSMRRIQTVGTYAERIEWRTGIKGIASFVDLEEITPRIRSIFSSQGFKDLDERKKLAIQTFIETTDGKIRDASDV